MTQTLPAARAETGVWIRVEYRTPAVDVFVRLEEIQQAVKNSRSKHTLERYEKAARAIAIGKRAGSYPRQAGDIRA